MSAAPHSTPVSVKKFCANRTEKCDCGNKYRENAEAKAPGWFTTDSANLAANAGLAYFEQRKNFKETGERATYSKLPEAHHVLCTSSVREGLIGNILVRPLIQETQWCINRSVNMKPMPLFGHTVKHYCNPMPGVRRVARLAAAPPFQNIPQHNHDHVPYRVEINTEINNLAKKIEKAMEKHTIKPHNIAAELDCLSEKYDRLLRARGLRLGGTHKAWEAAVNDPTNTVPWYQPFSMASTGVLTPIPFPPFAEKTGEWLDKIAFAIWGKG